MFGANVTVNFGGDMGQSVWLAYIIAGVFGCILFTLYYRLSQLNEHQGLADIIKNCFGKRFGTFINLILVFYLTFRTMTVGNNMTNMSSDLLMKDAPLRLVTSILLFAASYAIWLGFKTISRAAEIIFPMMLLAIIPFFYAAFSMKGIEYLNIFPIFPEGLNDVFPGLLRVSFIPFSETLIFLIFLPYLNVKDHKDFPKVAYGAIAFAAMLLGLVETTNVTILGNNLAHYLKYPFFSAMQLAGIRGVWERLDPLAAVILILSTFFKTTIYYYSTLAMLKSLSPKFNFKILIIACGIFTIIFAPMLKFDREFLYSTLPVIMIYTQLLFPLILWLISEKKEWRNKAA
jgi:spore germination protein KB